MTFLALLFRLLVQMPHIVLMAVKHQAIVALRQRAQERRARCLR